MAPDYAVRLRGSLIVPQDGVYELYLSADEAARMVLDGVTVIDMPAGTGALRSFSQTVQLRQGLIPLEILYYDGVGDAEIQLAWRPPGGEIQVVPPEALFVQPDAMVGATNGNGEFVFENVPAHVQTIRVLLDESWTSQWVSPVRGGTTSFGTLVVDRPR
jgi:hypothetical protein